MISLMLLFLYHPVELHFWTSFDSQYQCEEMMNKINQANIHVIAYCTDVDMSDMQEEAPI